MRHKIFHLISFLIGIVFLVPAVILAVFFRYPHFYTAFAFGGWLVLDFIDWKLNNRSILAYFYGHKHRDTFFVFFILASIFCFLVDYVYGVRLSGMWQWTNYKTAEYLVMYLFMNISYILGMYELFQVVRTILYKYFYNGKIKVINTKSISKNTYLFLVGAGFVCVLLPLYTLIFQSSAYIEYIMIFPFIGMLSIADGLTGLLGGYPLILKAVNFNHLHFIALVFTVFFGAGITEALNVFGGEWKYLKMPFPELTVYSVPVAVFVGWIPLVVGAITLVYFVKQLDFIWNTRKIKL